MRKNKGFTLVEILISVAVFGIVVGITTSVFSAAIKAQRKFLALQEVTSQTSYLLGYMERQTRMAKKDSSGNCLGVAHAGDDFLLTANGVKFLNYNDECIKFYEDGGVIKVDRDGTIRDLTSDKLLVNEFNINLSGEVGGDSLQSLITYFLEIEVRDPKIGEEALLRIQTTISQRNLDA